MYKGRKKAVFYCAGYPPLEFLGLGFSRSEDQGIDTGFVDDHTLASISTTTFPV